MTPPLSIPPVMREPVSRKMPAFLSPEITPPAWFKIPPEMVEW